MVQAGIARGVTAAECLAGTGLTATDLNDEDAEVWAAQEFDVIRNLIARLGSHPGVGIELATPSTVSKTGVAGFMILTSATVREALERAFAYLALWPTHLRFSLECDDQYAYLIADDSELPSDIRSFIVERDLAGILVALRGIHIDLAPLWVETTLNPGSAAELAKVYALPTDAVHPGRPRNRLAGPRRSLDLPLPQADPNTARMFERQCQELLTRRLAGIGISGRVRGRLMHSPGEVPTMPAIAADLNMNPRTLRRRLAAEGTSFRALLDEVRHKRALELVTRGLPIEEIATQLGYAETANFTHAFIRWEGLAPSYFRNGRLSLTNTRTPRPARPTR